MMVEAAKRGATSCISWLQEGLMWKDGRVVGENIAADSDRGKRLLVQDGAAERDAAR